MQVLGAKSCALNGMTDSYYDGWRVVEERDAADAILRQYVYGNYLDEVWTMDNRVGATVAQLNDATGNQRQFYHSNTLYSVHGITDETGAIKEAYQYDAYGKQTVITDGNDGDTIVNFGANDVRTVGGASTVGNVHMYTGQRFDAETGLLYYKERYHSTALGRFISRDPIGYEAGINLYEYVGSWPTDSVDPFGLFSPSDPICIKIRAWIDEQKRQLGEKM